MARKSSTAQKVEQALLERILFIGDEIPTGVSRDRRDKFVLLGSPQELIDQITHDLDYGR